MPTPAKKILIIEDSLDLRQDLIEELNKQGFEVLTAKNGQQGLDSALQEHPDLILLDIILPKMDGLTMLKKLRQDKWGKDVPVILLTVLDDDKEVFSALQRGVYDFLVKGDWKVEEIVDRVKGRLRLI